MHKNKHVDNPGMTRQIKAYLILIVAMLLAASVSRAEFTMNFNSDPAAVGNAYSGFNSVMSCSNSGCPQPTNLPLGVSAVPYTGDIFFNEVLQEASTGLYYWHTVVDQRTSNNFAQETFIEAHQPTAINWNCAIAFQLPCSQSRVYDRNDGYATTSYLTCNTAGGCNPSQPLYPSGATDGSTVPNGASYWNNAISPIDNNPLFTGIGTGQPKTTQIRQLLTDATSTWSQEFSKPFFAKKPKITQTYTDAQLTSSFALDMTALDYNTNTTPATVTYTTQLLGARSPGNAGDFNYATDKQLSNVTGGRYIYTNGTGYDGSDGTYTYVDSNFNPNDIIWKHLYDPTQNKLNSWSNYARLITWIGSPSAYALLSGHWTANQLFPGSDQDCNATNMTCPSSQGWK